MKAYYSTSEVAEMIGIHPNTVRLYEDLKLITKPERKENGYRVFTDLHISQFKIARLAFKVEVLQNGLRKKAINIIKACADCEFEKASKLTLEYLQQVDTERENAESAIKIAEQIIANKNYLPDDLFLTRKQAADYVNITIDTLRNWELNGLLTVKRKQNGYRVYDSSDIERLIIIKSLRCANYSLSAILRMLCTLSKNPEANIREVIDDTSLTGIDIITACDNLLTSLDHAQSNAREIYHIIHTEFILKK